MKNAIEVKNEVFEMTRKYKELMQKITQDLYDNPELGGKEYFAQKLVGKILDENGFDVEYGILDFETAFTGRYRNSSNGANIGLLVEYDALPEIGHGCGHNASCAISIVSAVILKGIMDKYNLEGTITVFGTPGEETICSKVRMAEEGVFDKLDIAMMVHAYDKWMIDCRTMALDSIEIVFKGKSVHAAAAPEDGVNALDAIMLTFSGINCLRQHIKDGSRIHGIVCDGGEAPNTVPGYGRARFYTRAEKRDYLDVISRKLKNCAEGAAIATGCSLEINNFETSLDNIKPCDKLMELFAANLAEIHDDSGIDMSPIMIGSTDVGNVSQIVPTIHPLMGLVKNGCILHTKEFADETIKEYAFENIAEAVYAVTCTAIDRIIEPDDII
ncbi:amidohydrolase [Dethiosulfatibacter aminovorans DSM 17477]|uniref:Peptidase M20 domain-containing protein 2 n=1 Tax=Dethiosulfatibacter aminovorans DSM 17477 TaxID=1121476 RepID=A0A1M6F4Y6_9FIRM|nr:M20 family metallopeptidase [Dethiosulfatibacter aminovorans]SHI92726.1 amidohydrolase [Dethiosulfatibacter aminovorans DSM 17477]